jgi:hypothetical protein
LIGLLYNKENKDKGWGRSKEEKAICEDEMANCKRIKPNQPKYPELAFVRQSQIPATESRRTAISAS